MKQLSLGIVLAASALFVGCDPDPEPMVPGFENFSGTLTEDLTLVDRIEDPTIADYCVTGKWMIEAILTVEPGVVICFEPDASLEIGENGVLEANGTAPLPIRFTGAVPTAGSWRGIYVESPDLRNSLDFCIVEHAGSDAVNSIYWDAIGAIALRDIGELSITNTIIRNGLGYGIALEDKSEIREFANNTIENMDNAAIYCSLDQVGSFDSNSSLTGGNGFDGVLVFPSRLDEPQDQTMAAFADGSAYRIGGDVVLLTGLYVEAGTNIEVAPSGIIRVNYSSDAFLNAVGTAANPITITGQITTGSSWNGISFFTEDARNELSYCNISYAGNDPVDDIWFPGVQAAIGMRDDASLQMTNCTISNSGGCGVYVEPGGMLTQSGNTFMNNDDSDICS